MDSQKAIEGLTELLNCNYIGSLSGEDIESLENAVETMRKYQQIEQIVSDFRKYQKGITWGFGGEKYMQMVSEVVDNGDDV